MGWCANSTLWQDLFSPWFKCSMQLDCILPAGKLCDEAWHATNWTSDCMQFTFKCSGLIVMWFSSKCLVNLSDTQAQYQVHQFQSRFDKALYVLVSVTRHLGHGGRGGLRKRPRHAQDDYLSSDPEFGAFAYTFRTRKAKSFSSFCEQKRKILFTNSTVQAMRMREVSTN